MPEESNCHTKKTTATTAETTELPVPSKSGWARVQTQHEPHKKEKREKENKYIGHQ